MGEHGGWVRKDYIGWVSTEYFGWVSTEYFDVACLLARIQQKIVRPQELQLRLIPRPNSMDINGCFASIFFLHQ